MKTKFLILSILLACGSINFAQVPKNELIAHVLGAQNFQYKRLVDNGAFGTTFNFSNSNTDGTDSQYYGINGGIGLLGEVRKKPIENLTSYVGISLGFNTQSENYTYKNPTASGRAEFSSNSKSFAGGIYAGGYYHFSKRMFITTNFATNILTIGNGNSSIFEKVGSTPKLTNSTFSTFRFGITASVGLGYSF